MELLKELVHISHSIELWRTDALLHGGLCLKLCCLHEAKAERRDTAAVEANFLFHDRSQLLHCQEELERGLRCIKLARERCDTAGSDGDDVGGPVTDLCLLHADFIYALTRVQVKLAGTIPPPGETVLL